MDTEHKKRFKQRVIDSHEFICAEDGYYYLWMDGLVSPAALRILADHLDEKNKARDEQVSAMLTPKNEVK
jgi:hypothetical protein